MKLKTDIFEIVYQSIMDIMVAPGDFYEDRNVLKRLLPGTIDVDKEKLVTFLNAIDTGIVDIGYFKEGDHVFLIRYIWAKMGKSILWIYLQSQKGPFEAF